MKNRAFDVSGQARTANGCASRRQTMPRSPGGAPACVTCSGRFCL